MKKLIFVFILILFGVNAFSQWFYQNNPDSITTISSGSFINSNTGWYTRSKGEISKTTDGGVTWNTYKATNVDLNSIDFVNENTGYVCGNSGRLMKSTNGGLNWSWQNPLSNDTLVSVDFVNENTGWCAGRDFIIYTTTGGAQWYKQNVDTNTIKPRFTVLKMYDSQYGLAGAYNKNNISGDFAYIYRTSNGGVNWNITDSVWRYRVRSICYTNQNIIYLCSYGYLYRSINGGISWNMTSSLSGYIFNSQIQFKNENTGWIIYDKYILKTDNGGQNWGVNLITKYTNLANINCSLEGNIYVATNKGIVYKSTNEGINWGNYSINLGIELYGISIMDANNIMVGDDNGAVWKSTNGGINWQNKFRDSIGNISGPYFVNSNIGFLCSAQRFLYKSTNAGENWYRIGGTFYHNIYSMLCKNENNLWVVGDSGMIMRTTNSGISWEDKSLSLNSLVYGIIENNNVLFVKVWYNDSALFKSTNNGNSWIHIPMDSIQSSFNLNFINSQVGLIIPILGNIFYKTYDGGNTWNKYHRSSEYLILNSYFSNENTGYAVTSSYYYEGLIKTTNSGINWNICSTFVFSNFMTYNIAFLNDNTGWIVGQNGLICKTTNAGLTFIALTNNDVPKNYFLSQNYPNPFNPSTNIKYQIANNSFISLKIYDILGKEVTTLVNENLKPGEYETTFDGINLPSGIYFYSVYSDGKLINTKKMILLK